tara:strand:- start:704 stop:805 length:102 start_codon:yes stop_codon:yes gene_type:complete
MIYLSIFVVGMALGFYAYELGFRAQLPFYKEKK